MQLVSTLKGRHAALQMWRGHPSLSTDNQLACALQMWRVEGYGQCTNCQDPTQACSGPALGILPCALQVYRGCGQCSSLQALTEACSWPTPGNLPLCIAGVEGVWAVHQFSGPDTGMQLASPGGAYHSHLLLSSPSTGETKVLAAGGELQQVDDSDFVTAAPTLAAANILRNTRIVQVSKFFVVCIPKQSW